MLENQSGDFFFFLYSQCEEEKSMQETGRARDLWRSPFLKTPTGWIGFYAGQKEPAESTAVKLGGTVYTLQHARDLDVGFSFNSIFAFQENFVIHKKCK